MKYSEIKQIILLRRRLGDNRVWNDDPGHGDWDGEWWADVPFGDNEMNIPLTFEGLFMSERVEFINYVLDLEATIEHAEADVARVYCHITDGRLSKLNTDPSLLIAMVDDLENARIESLENACCTCEHQAKLVDVMAIQALEAERDTLDAVVQAARRVCDNCNTPERCAACDYYDVHAALDAARGVTE